MIPGKLREIVRFLLFFQIFIFGLASILATGGGGTSGPDPTRGALSFSSSTYTATEGTDASITITVVRLDGSDGTASVDYATTNGTATEPSDYTASSGTLNWAADDATAKTFNIPINDNNNFESQEIFSITLSNAVGARLGTTINATVTINDDDPAIPGTLQFSSANYTAAEGTDTSVLITVTRTGGSDGAASVDYATANGTAIEPGDYTATSGTLNWATGDAASKTFSIPITDDSSFENQEAFSIALSNVSGASLGATANATVTINDDDPAPAPGSLQFSNANYSATEGVDASVLITVTRAGGSFGAASVDYATADGTATQPGDYTDTSGTLNWNDGDQAPKVITVPITDDNVAEVLQSFTVSLSNASGATLGSTTSANVAITDNDLIGGKLSAPGGVLAMKAPGLLDRLFAAIFGKPLKADISDLVSPVAGATVNLYAIDETGAVGAILDTATTDANGDYELLSPPGNAPAVNYIVRAEGAAMLDSRVTGMHVDIDPTTDATSDLVTTIASDFGDLSIKEVREMQDVIGDMIPDIVTTDTPSASQISERLQSLALRRIGIYNILYSKVSAGEICGNIQSPAGSALAELDIVVRDYVDWRTRATTTTDTSGNYCVNVPVQGDTDPDGGTFEGEYIVGAFNRTDDALDAERSASEWWSAGGASYSRLDAGKIAVTVGTPSVNNINMQLAQGARIKGDVTASGSILSLEGVNIVLSDYDTGLAMASTSVEADGSYRINVIPGTYLVEAINTTQAPFASLIYDGETGTNVNNLGLPITVAAGDETNIDFTLEAGTQLTGTITDGATTNPVMRARVRIEVAGGSYYGNEFTDRLGFYHIWVKPGSYDIYAYGQNIKAINLGVAGTTVNQDFNKSVSKIEGVLVDGSSNPVRLAKLRLYNSTYDFMAADVSDGNGAFSVYTDLIDTHHLEIRIDRPATVGSIIYNGKMNLEGSDPITTTFVGDDKNLTTLTLPAGGLLKGNVYASDPTVPPVEPLADFRIQVRYGDVFAANRLLTLRTRGDGRYLISLPEAIYDRIKMIDATVSNGNCNNVPVVAGNTTILDFIDTGSGTTGVCNITAQ